MKNESKIEKEDENDEEGFTILDIEKDSIIFILSEIENKSNENNFSLQIDNNNIDDNQKQLDNNNSKTTYSFFLNNKKIYSSEFLPENPLYLVRKE